MIVRKTTITTILIVALITACGGDEDPGGYSGTGDKATTTFSGYN